MKRILFLGVLVFFLTSGTAFAMGPAIGLIMKGGGMMGGKMGGEQEKQHDNKQGEIRSEQNEMDSQKITYDKKYDDDLTGCHSGTTQDDASADKKADAVRDKQEHAH